jgi:hypothetical protein
MRIVWKGRTFTIDPECWFFQHNTYHNKAVAKGNNVAILQDGLLLNFDKSSSSIAHVLQYVIVFLRAVPYDKVI